MGPERVRERCWRCRGRIRETPWYSFFTWGWHEPVSWWNSFRYDGKDYQAPTAMVDLSKPAFKVGVAALKVGIAVHELQVNVTADKPQYLVRQKAIAPHQGWTQNGKPVPGAQVAFAAVDEGLLALKGNDSWGPARGNAAGAAVGAWRRARRRARSSAGAITGARPSLPAVAVARAPRASCSTRCWCGTRTSPSMPTAKRQSRCRSTIR